MKFSCTTSSTAKASKIMAIWKDVEHWKKWDYELQYAWIPEKLKEGTTGVMKSRRSWENKFTVEHLSSRRMVIAIDIPLSKLRITRIVVPGRKGCIFMHETSFEGPFGLIYGLLYGGRFKRELPLVMAKVKKLAEK